MAVRNMAVAITATVHTYIHNNVPTMEYESTSQSNRFSAKGFVVDR